MSKWTCPSSTMNLTICLKRVQYENFMNRVTDSVHYAQSAWNCWAKNKTIPSTKADNSGSNTEIKWSLTVKQCRIPVFLNLIHVSFLICKTTFYFLQISASKDFKTCKTFSRKNRNRKEYTMSRTKSLLWKKNPLMFKANECLCSVK